MALGLLSGIGARGDIVTEMGRTSGRAGLERETVRSICNRLFEMLMRYPRGTKKEGRKAAGLEIRTGWHRGIQEP